LSESQSTAEQHISLALPKSMTDQKPQPLTPQKWNPILPKVLNRGKERPQVTVTGPNTAPITTTPSFTELINRDKLNEFFRRDLSDYKPGAVIVHGPPMECKLELNNFACTIDKSVVVTRQELVTVMSKIAFAAGMEIEMMTTSPNDLFQYITRGGTNPTDPSNQVTFYMISVCKSATSYSGKRCVDLFSS